MSNKKVYINENGELNIEKLICDYKNYVMTILHKTSTLLSEDDLEEICSDVFLTIWNNRSKLDLNEEFTPYIAAITHNLIKKKYREITFFENIEEYQNLADISNIEITISNKEENFILLKELNKFRKIDIDIFKKFYFYDESIKEISKELNISTSKVKVSLHRTRRKLEKILRERGF